MKLFAVYLNKNFEAKKAIFVKEGFCYPAFFIPLIWALYNSLWEAILMFLLLISISVYLYDHYFIGHSAFLMVTLFISLYFGASGNDWKQLACWRKGFKLHQVIMARDIDEAKLLFYRSINLESFEDLERKIAT